MTDQSGRVLTAADITCERCGVMAGDGHVRNADHPLQKDVPAHVPTGPNPCCYHCGPGRLVPGSCSTPNRHPYRCNGHETAPARVQTMIDQHSATLNVDVVAEIAPARTPSKEVLDKLAKETPG